MSMLVEATSGVMLMMNECALRLRKAMTFEESPDLDGGDTSGEASEGSHRSPRETPPQSPRNRTQDVVVEEAPVHVRTSGRRGHKKCKYSKQEVRDIVSLTKVEPSTIPEDFECAICMDDEEKRFCTMVCGHTYHYMCIKIWLRRGGDKCPLCAHTIALKECLAAKQK
ncbi:hypothetical protein NDN08_002429 [Rhodosorus marinus]|uniref:RING-type domain-containing protein n=1 Tax=Rhodosorus marinus TaxID=101924 RepID=A0AAV8UTS3_9RHOD|nr:hypothetical protein NDN08_002429 [Rhodosorus marinus]